MAASPRFVLVNRFQPHKWLLCDREGETYSTLGRALLARDKVRVEADNPWIDVFKLVPVGAEDLE